MSTRISNAQATIMRVMSAMADQLASDGRSAREERRDAGQESVEARLRAADAKKAAAQNEYYIQNLEGTIGVVPMAGKLATTVLTAGQEDLGAAGLVTCAAGGVYLPAGAALLAAAGLRPEARRHLDGGSEGTASPLLDNPVGRTFAYADRAERDHNRDLADREEITAKTKEETASSAKEQLDAAKQGLEELMRNTKELLQGVERVNDKVAG